MSHIPTPLTQNLLLVCALKNCICISTCWKGMFWIMLHQDVSLSWCLLLPTSSRFEAMTTSRQRKIGTLCCGPSESSDVVILKLNFKVIVGNSIPTRNHVTNTLFKCNFPMCAFNHKHFEHGHAYCDCNVTLHRLGPPHYFLPWLLLRAETDDSANTWLFGNGYLVTYPCICFKTSLVHMCRWKFFNSLITSLWAREYACSILPSNTEGTCTSLCTATIEQKPCILLDKFALVASSKNEAGCLQCFLRMSSLKRNMSIPLGMM